MPTFPVSVFLGTNPSPEPGEIEFGSRIMTLRLSGNRTEHLSYSILTAALGGIEGLQTVLQAAGPPAWRIYLDSSAEKVWRQITDPAAQSLSARLIQERQSLSRQRRSRQGRWALRIIVGVLLAWALYGVLVDAATILVPRRWEQKLADLYVSNSLNEIHVPGVDTPLQALAKQVLAGVSNNPYRFHFAVKRNSAINAYAVPGGYVVVYSGLLAAADSPDEIAGVLAHEIQHVLRRHALHEFLYEHLLMILLDGLSGGSSHWARNAEKLTTLNFSRSQEAEADRLGVALLHRDGLSAAGLLHFFEKAASRESHAARAMAWASTHPTDHKRLNTLRAAVKHEPPGFRQAAIDWPAFQKALALASLDSAQKDRGR